MCDSLRGMRVIDDPVGVAECLNALAWIAAARKQAVLALTLMGAADAAWAAVPAVMQPALRGYHDAALGAAREALPESECQAALAKGTAMSRADAIALALGESSRPAPRSEGTRRARVPARLTRREQDVAVLVARGLSNSQIAAGLVISARTVETHVQHIMDKLGVSTRAQIAAWSAGQPLKIRGGIREFPDAGRAAIAILGSRHALNACDPRGVGEETVADETHRRLYLVEHDLRGLSGAAGQRPPGIG